MTWTNRLMDGARLAFYASLQLAIVNGVWRRFSPTHTSLTNAVQSRLGVGNGGMN